MGLHICPIEPDDWANGPNGGDEECEQCGGSGIVMIPTGNPEVPCLPIPCDCTTTRDNDRWEDDAI